MPDTFAITILFIIICTVVGVFARGRSRDRCLRCFSDSTINLESKDGTTLAGSLCVENSGIELRYDNQQRVDDQSSFCGTSYILYKNEYDSIFALIRNASSLDTESFKERTKELERFKQCKWNSGFNRKIRNFFGTVRDSLLEISSLLMGRVKSATPAGNVLKGQDKYTSSLQKQLIGSAATSYEPILERYIGKKVVINVAKGEVEEKYAGILKDYTTEFIMLMEVQYNGQEADLVMPRSVGVVRHAGE